MLDLIDLNSYSYYSIRNTSPFIFLVDSQEEIIYFYLSTCIEFIFIILIDRLI